jgi:hypothetical protein
MKNELTIGSVVSFEIAGSSQIAVVGEVRNKSAGKRRVYLPAFGLWLHETKVKVVPR